MAEVDMILQRASQGLSLDPVALVIDAHAHLGETLLIHTHAGDAESMLASMERIGIRTTCLSSFRSLAGDVLAGNDEVAQVVRRFPGRFAGYAVINPNLENALESELERCLEGGGHWAVKIHSVFHAYPTDGKNYRRIYAWLSAYGGGVVLSHMFESPDTLRRLSDEYPAVVFIMAHAGGYDGRTPYPFARVIREQANVYADITLSVVPFGGLESLVEECGAEKLLFASDTPFLDFAHQVGRVTHARLTLEQKRLILGENMRSIMMRYQKNDKAG